MQLCLTKQPSFVDSWETKMVCCVVIATDNACAYIIIIYAVVMETELNGQRKVVI